MKNIIVCPKCGYQYTPAEIFIPDYFLGKPSFIKRDIDGEIIDVIGTKPDLTELYRCDSCGTSFNIKASIDFETNVDVETDFNTPYRSTIK